MCEQKASEFESRQALRDEEQVALGKAIEIMCARRGERAAVHRNWRCHRNIFNYTVPNQRLRGSRTH